MPSVTVSRHYLDQIDEDHFQLEQLFRAVKAVQSRLYAVEAELRSVLAELDDLALGQTGQRQIAHDPEPVGEHDRHRRKRRSS
jgi:hypothetical protein